MRGFQAHTPWSDGNVYFDSAVTLLFFLLIGLGVGVIDIKVNTVETPEEVARRIEAAGKSVGENRVTWVHPDCGFWMNKRSIADRKMESLVKGRDLYLGAAR